MSWRVLVTARAFWMSGDLANEALKAAGCTVARSPEAGPLPEADLVRELQDCDAVIASSDPYNVAVFEQCPRLKIVARCGVGIDSVDLAAAEAAGVVVTNTPGAMTDAVADYTFGLMLAIARKIPEGFALMKSGGWGEYPGVLLSGKTLGLVGFGQIGRGVARRAAGFGMKVLAFDPPLRTALDGRPVPDLPGVDLVDLHEVLERSDFVSVHAPATPETRGLIGEQALSRMKPTAYLINTARGSLVDEEALLAALEAGQIAGAAIDVYRQEPLPSDHPLRRAPRCLLTPHCAFNAAEAAAEMSRQSAESIILLMRGGTPPSVCNPAVLTSPACRWKSA